MRVLVTGAAGFIGSHIIEALDTTEYDVLGVDTYDKQLYNTEESRSLGHFNNLSAVSRLVLPVDVRTEAFVHLLIDYAPDIIIHLAADSRTLTSGIYDVLTNNLLPMRKILAYSDKSGCRIIYASSASVYGEIKLMSAPFSEESTEIKPQNAYAFSKLQLERISANHNAVGVRFFNVYGYNECYKGRTGSLASQIIQNHMTGRKTPIFIDSDKTYRDFVYIDTVVQLIAGLISSNYIGIVNAGSGKPRTFYEIYRILDGLIGLGEPEYIENYVHSGYQTFTWACTDRMKAIVPEVVFPPIEEGLKELVKKYGYA